ncbi:MAG: hypothetical protein XXXJIFNMEKO3_02224 [Candidatus Erwinia impunctatus]|nr:hypothetical protein XXXJIFNMEKO_02224 [Culicoides impunctatus]
MRTAFLNLMKRLHLYIGLFAAPFIFVAALTGTLYVLTPQLENYFYREALTVTPEGEQKTLSAQITAARDYAGSTLKIYAVRPSPSAEQTTRVQFVSDVPRPSESRSVFVDPYTLQIKGDMTVYGTSGILPFRMWLDKLHQGVLLGNIGRIYSELAASWLWVAVAGGIFLWWSGRSRHKANKQKRGFVLFRYWHTTLGLFLAGGLFFFSVTGLTWSQWAGGNIDKMRSSLNWLTPQVSTQLAADAQPEVHDAHAEHHHSGMHHQGMEHGESINPPDGNWDSVLMSARLAGLTSAKIELRQPKAADRAWTVTEIDRSWPTQVDAVSVNPHDYSVIDHIHFEQFPLIAKLTRWGIDAHMGILFGLPNQLILVAFGVGLCLMIALGYRMWWIRRSAMAKGNPLDTICGVWNTLRLSQKLLVLSVVLPLSYLLPVMGGSLLVFLLIDIWRWRKLNQKQLAFGHQ